MFQTDSANESNRPIQITHQTAAQISKQLHRLIANNSWNHSYSYTAMNI